MQVQLSDEVVDALKKIIAENGLSTLDEAIMMALGEHDWLKSFVEQPEVLDQLEEEIAAEIAAGRTEDLDIDALEAENAVIDQMQQGDIPLTGAIQDIPW